MVRMFKPIALVGAVLMLSSAPAFATEFDLSGINFNPLGLDLDPFHIFTPAAEPAAAPVKKHHHHHHHKKA